MEVLVNGESKEIQAAASVEDLVQHLSLTPARIAIELNREVIRRNDWAKIILKENDRIEIVHFVGGG